MKKIMLLLPALVLCLSLCACARTGDVQDFACTVTIDDTPVSGTYTGPVVKDRPDGEGTFTATLEDGTLLSCSGTWSTGVSGAPVQVENYPYCFSESEVEFSGTYDGDLSGWLPEGEGSFTPAGKAELYSGAWENGLPEEKGWEAALQSRVNEAVASGDAQAIADLCETCPMVEDTVVSAYTDPCDAFDYDAFLTLDAMLQTLPEGSVRDRLQAYADSSAKTRVKAFLNGDWE